VRFFQAFADWFGVGDKGCANVTLRTEDMPILLVSYRNVSAALSPPNKVYNSICSSRQSMYKCSAVDLHEKVAQLPFQSTNVQEMLKCRGGFSAEKVGFL
jgi:hypothetical protein